MDVYDIVRTNAREYVETEYVSDSEDSVDILLAAVELGDLEFVKFMVDFGVDIGHDAISLASSYGYIDILKYIVQYVDDIDEQTIEDAIQEEGAAELKVLMKRFSQLKLNKPAIQAVDKALEYKNVDALGELIGRVTVTREVIDRCVVLALDQNSDLLIYKCIKCYNYGLDETMSLMALRNGMHWIVNQFPGNIRLTGIVDEYIRSNNIKF
jgi:hypothetical protein